MKSCCSGRAGGTRGSTAHRWSWHRDAGCSGETLPKEGGMARAKKPVERVLRKGAKKPDPFTIVIVANPALESPWRSGTFVADPVTSNQTAFNACAGYIKDALFGT